MAPVDHPAVASVNGVGRIREVVGSASLVVAALAVVAITVQADLRTPLQLPGHRGVLWLGLLVATALLARRAGLAAVTGLVSAGLVLGLGLSPAGVLGVLPYVLAAVALDVLLQVGAVRSRPWLLALLAGPVHLLALVVPLARGVRVGVAPSAALPGMSTVALSHLVFGLAAGLVGWALWRFSRSV